MDKNIGSLLMLRGPAFRDNTFIANSVFPKMREGNHRRQSLFSTRDANVLLLSDAELIVGLISFVEASHEHLDIPENAMGSINSETAREIGEELLEGEKQAFEMRRLKYGF